MPFLLMNLVNILAVELAPLDERRLGRCDCPLLSTRSPCARSFTRAEQLLQRLGSDSTPSSMVLLPFHLSILLFSVSYFFFKYYTSFAHFPFLNLLLLRLDLLLLAFRDGRIISMLTQSILPSSFIFI